jgi:hypothetical protein
MNKISSSGPARKQSLKELQTIPGVGPNIAEHLWKIGIRSVRDLKCRDPEKLYRAMCRREKAVALAREIRPRASTAEADPREKPGAPVVVDRCLLYVCRCAVYYASKKKHDPRKLLWWNWKDTD